MANARISKPYVRPIVRGKEVESVEFGAKVNNILVDGISFIEKLFFNVIKQLRVSAQRELNAASAFEAMFHEHGFIQCISVILGHKLQPASQIIWRGYIPICFICPWNADFHNLRLNANSTILREEQIYCISYGKFATVGIPAYKALLCERAPMIAFFVIGKYKPSSIRFHIKQL